MRRVEKVGEWGRRMEGGEGGGVTVLFEPELRWPMIIFDT